MMPKGGRNDWLRLGACGLGLLASFGACAGELGDLLRDARLHPQVKAAETQTQAALAQQDAASGRYLGSGALAAGWRKYDGLRTIGSYAPGTQPLPPLSDRLGVAGITYSLPVDLFSAIKANNERARHDLRAAELAERQQTLLKLHQAASAFIMLQALIKQRDALVISRQRVEATYKRVMKEVELGKAAGVDARYAESELQRLVADEATLSGSIAQAQSDLREATGRAGFLPSVANVRIPAWASGDGNLPTQIAQARAEAASAQADEARRSLMPSVALETNYSMNGGPVINRRDTWYIGAVVSVPLNASQYRQSAAQKLTAEAAAQQSEAAGRDAERQIASLNAGYDSAMAEVNAMEKEVSYREQVSSVEHEMQRLGNQTLENMFRHERDLLDARYRLAQAKARAAVSWSAAQVVIGAPVETYIAQMDAQ